MRVTLVAPLVAPLRATQAGGAQVILTELARRLAERGEEVEIVAAPGSRVAGVAVHAVRGAPFPQAMVRGLDAARTPGTAGQAIVHDLEVVGAPRTGAPAMVHGLNTAGAPPTGAQSKVHGLNAAGAPGTGAQSNVHGLNAARTPGAGAQAKVHRAAAPETDEHPWPPLQATAYLRVAAHLRATRPAVVHAHALDWPVFYALAAAGLPTVHTLHLAPLDPAAAAAARAAAQATPRPTFVAVSRACAAQWRGIVPVDMVIGNGADPDSIPYSGTPEPDLALVAGRVAPEKGTHLAIAAALRVGMRVVVAGDVYDRPYFDEQVAPLLGPRVEHLGPVPRRRLARLYGRAAVALVASLWEEPFGMVALEANLAGTPVAGFARGALAEVVGAAGGVLTDDITVDGLATAIHKAAALDRRAARRSAAQRHPLDRMVERYRALYRTLARQG